MQGMIARGFGPCVSLTTRGQWAPGKYRYRDASRGGDDRLRGMWSTISFSDWISGMNAGKN